MMLLEERLLVGQVVLRMVGDLFLILQSMDFFSLQYI
jgi:hypothetical protein